MSPESDFTSTIVKFVNFALSQKERTGICDILGEIANATNSYGAILWEPDPDIPLEKKDARLFTAGHWFSTGIPFASHDLSIHKSLAGGAIRQHKLVLSNNILRDHKAADTSEARQFYSDHNILKCQVAPIRFADRVGSISLFRKVNEPDYVDADKPLFLKFCELLPGLHEALHHKVSFGLIDRVKDILQTPVHGPEKPTVVWTELSKAVQEWFHLIEVSIFLEDPVRCPGKFCLEHTTERKFVRREAYDKEAQGLTSWVIKNRKSLLIWDLRYQKRPKEQQLMKDLYPGLTWLDPKDLQKITAGLPGISEELVPPLGFIAEPIVSGNVMCGVLRCCAAKKAPYYFTERERSLFAVIASQIGQFWTKWLGHRTIHEENQAGNQLVNSISMLNESLNAELRQPTPDLRNVFEKGLDAAANMISVGEIIDIRLADRSKEELYVAYTKGSDWTDTQKQMRFDLNGSPPSPGVQVFHEGRTQVFPDIQDHFQYKSAFPRAKALLIAPIRSSNQSYGVIDIRSTESQQFPEHAKQMAELLGQQLGLYHELINTVGTTNAAFADWQHQIRGPIAQAFIRLRDTIRTDFSDYEDVPQYLKVQSGLLRKARQASLSLQLFLHLTKGEKLKSKFQNLVRSELIKRLVECCLDNQVLNSTRRAIDFHVKSDSFRPLEGHPLSVDIDLFDQVINNIIDNAFKYSYSQTIIEVQGIAEASSFSIAVTNIGIPLLAADLEKAVKRGWRSEQAQSVVGEGAGIGLWVVDHIMRAHGGRMELAPTSQRKTRVKLTFPWR